ncbi:hypothetical protein AALP_AAs51720U000300 [Arabis alpina]|uniref:Uncharacterized protein n=1 Tax=Arabis alpina TaxID=50452 RepID=A0A087G2W7_ARAAL|nr:hypothetical protein AALP_AAs51720U000300 [Arabis alpina]
MSSTSSFENFLENVLKPRTTRVEDAGLYAEKACSDSASSSWLHPHSKKTAETQASGWSNEENPRSSSHVEQPVDVVPAHVEELVNDAPVFVDVKAEMEEFDNLVEQRRLERFAGSRRRAPRLSRKKRRAKNFRLPDPPGSSISSEKSLDRSEEVQSEMGKRSFRELASGSAGASEATPSTAPTLAPNTISLPSTTPAPSSASAAKKTARIPPSVVIGMPASDSKAARSSVPLASSRSGEDARKKAKGKAHETVTSHRRGSEPRGDNEREPKRPRNDPPSPSVCLSQSVFDDDVAAARLFATMVFLDDPYTRVCASSLGTMSRAGLKAEIEKQKRRANDYAKGELAAKTKRNKYVEQLEKRNKELERALGDNKRLRVENEKLAKKFETAKKDASNSFECLTRCNEQVAKLKMQVGQKRELLKTAKALIVDLHEQFAIAKSKFEELKGDPQDKMVFQIQREANLDFVKQLLGLFPDRKVPRLEDELASLTADVEANVGDEEYFDKLMESLGECLDVVLPEDVSLEKLAAEAGVADVSGSVMFSENARGLLQEMRIDSAGLLKNLMISKDGHMSFAGEDEAEVTMVVAEDIEAEVTTVVAEDHREECR